MDRTSPLSPCQRIFFGLLSIACGLAPMLAAFDVGPLDSRDINGPPWLGLVGGGIFVLAGLVIWMGRVSPLVSGLLALFLCAGLAAIGNWIAFGAGERMCAGSLDIAFLWSDARLSGLACRIPFGIGALITDGFVLIIAARTLQTALGGPPRLVRLVRFSEWAFFATLLPILLPVFLFMIVPLAGKAVVTRLRTGQWPRNEKFIQRQQARDMKKNLPP